MAIRKKHVFLIIIFLLFFSSCRGEKIRLNNLEEKVNNSKYGVRIDFQILDKKNNKPLPYSKVLIRLTDERRILLFTDVNGRLSIGFNKYFYLKNKPRFNFKSNFEDEKIKINYKIINKLKYEGTNKENIDNQNDIFMSQVLSKDYVYSKKNYNLSYFKITGIRNLLKYSHLTGQIDFFYKINSAKKEMGTFIIEGMFDNGDKELFQIYSNNDGYFRFVIFKKWITQDPKYFIFSENIDTKKPYLDFANIHCLGEEKSITFFPDYQNLFFVKYLNKKFDSENTINYFYVSSLLDNLNSIHSKNFSFYFHKEDESSAKKILNNIEKDIIELNDKFHIDFKTGKNKLKLIIHRSISNQYYILTKNKDEIINSFPSSNIYENHSFLIHEITESSVTKKLHNLYKNDKFTRWIGDGLARYMEFYFFKKYNINKRYFVKSKLFGILKIRKSGFINNKDKFKGKYYNLKIFEAGTVISNDPSIPIGDLYTIAMYFWYKITNKCGDQIIGEFLNEAAKLDKPTNKELVPLLSKITGMDIDKELNVNLEEVVEFVNNN